MFEILTFVVKQCRKVNETQNSMVIVGTIFGVSNSSTRVAGIESIKTSRGVLCVVG